MTYPALTRKDTAAYVEGRRDGTLSEANLSPEERGSDSDDNYDAIITTLDKVKAEFSAADLSKFTSQQLKDGLEGPLSVVLHEGLKGMPAYLLSDMDFWRFCSAYLFDFVEWRNKKDDKSLPSLENYAAKANGLNNRNCTAHRMFDRAHIAHIGGTQAGLADPYEYAKFGASDVWRSHVLRPLHGNAPVLVHEVVGDVKAGKLPTSKVRPLAKHLQRVRANVLFEVLDQPQARDLLDRETQRVENGAAT